MRRILFGAVVLALPTTGPAHAERPTLAGDVCTWRSSPEPRPQGGDEFAVLVSGGPIAAARVVTMIPALDEVLDDNLYAITLTCSIKVGESDHTSPTAASATANGLGVAVLAPVHMVYRDPSFAGLAICTEVTVTDRDGESATLYWDVADEEFGTDPSVTCGPVACVTSADDACHGGPPSIPPEPVRDAVDLANQVIVEHVDPPLCAVLDDLFPPEGDVPDVWDCPPYQRTGPELPSRPLH